MFIKRWLWDKNTCKTCTINSDSFSSNENEYSGMRLTVDPATIDDRATVTWTLTRAKF